MLRFLFFCFSFLLVQTSFGQCLIPNGQDTSSCGPASVDLTVSGSTGFYNWYDSPTGPSFLDTGVVFSTPFLSVSDTFYVAEFDTGATNNALLFDGTSDFVYIDRFNYEATGLAEVTVEAWIKTTDPNDQIIASYDRSEYWRLEVNGDGGGSGQIGWSVSTDTGIVDLGGVSQVDDGLWHHVAGVYDNGTMLIYVDGVLEATSGGTSSFGTGLLRYGFIGTGSEAVVPNGVNTPNDFFNGEIGGVRIWSTARTAAELNQNQNNCLVGPQASLSHDFRMNGSGTEVFLVDYSGNQNDGFLQTFALPAAWGAVGPTLNSCFLCESGRDTVEVLVESLPNNFLGNDSCVVASSLVLDPGMQNSYLWQDNSTNQTFTATSSGFYNVLVDFDMTYGGLCDDRDTIHLFILNDRPLANQDSFCLGEPQELTATGSTGLYKWYPEAMSSVLLDTGVFRSQLTQTDTFYVSAYDTLQKSSVLLFDGTNSEYGAINYSYAAAGLPEMTVETWIKTTNGDDQVIASFDRSDYWRLEINGSGAGLGQIAFDIVTDVGLIDFGGVVRIDDGDWHHIAAVFDNGLISIYVDGVLDNSTTQGTTFGNGVTKFGFLAVGSEATVFDGTTGPNDYFDGEMASFKLWSRALSQTEIQDNLGRCRLGSEDGLELYYNFTEETGMTLVDQTGNGRDASLRNTQPITSWKNSNLTIFACPSPCETERDTVILVIEPVPQPNLGGDVCATTTATIDAGTNYLSYLWSTGESTQTVSLTSASDEQLSVIVDSAGTTCLGYDTVKVRIVDIPTAEDSARCDTGIVNLKASGLVNQDYVWTDIDGNIISRMQNYQVEVESRDTFLVSGTKCDTVSRALEFDGLDDHIALNMSYNSVGAIPLLTVEAWVNTSFSSGGNFDNWSIVDFDRSEYYNLFVTGSGLVGFSTASTSGGINDFYGNPADVVNDGNWHHIAGVYDGTNKYIYVDGQLSNTIVNPHGGAALGTGLSRFGIVGDGSEAATFNAGRNNNYYEGLISNLRIWSAVRSADQINAMKDFCLDGTEPNLEAWYRFDESGGSQTLTDYSGNNRDGQLFNFDFAIDWQTTTNEIFCDCCTSDPDSAIAIAFLPIDSNRFTIACPGIDSTLVRVEAFGGTNQFDFRELSGEFNYSSSFQAGADNRRYLNNSNFQLEIQDENGCLDTTSNFSTPQTPMVVASTNTSGACELLAQGNFSYVVNASNEVLVGLRNTAKDLGTVSSDLYFQPASMIFNNEAYLERHFTLNADTVTFPTTEIRYYLTNAEFNSIQDSAVKTSFSNDDVTGMGSLGATKYNGPTEDGVYDPTDATNLVFLPQVSNGSSFGVNWVQLETTSFSEFWPHASNTSSPLPVELLWFDARYIGGGVLLSWSTATEVNNDFFTVQKSVDGRLFKDLANIQGVGNSLETRSYQFIDRSQLEENNYYRLLQTDFDGTVAELPVRLVKMTESSADVLRLFPNPTKNWVRVESDFPLDKTNLEIFNSFGKRLEVPLSVNSEFSLTLELEKLTAGIYYLSFTSFSKKEVRRLVVVD